MTFNVPLSKEEEKIVNDFFVEHPRYKKGGYLRDLLVNSIGEEVRIEKGKTQLSSFTEGV